MLKDVELNSLPQRRSHYLTLRLLCILRKGPSVPPHYFISSHIWRIFGRETEVWHGLFRLSHICMVVLKLVFE